jgi:hypothetical protein
MEGSDTFGNNDVRNAIRTEARTEPHSRRIYFLLCYQDPVVSIHSFIHSFIHNAQLILKKICVCVRASVCVCVPNYQETREIVNAGTANLSPFCLFPSFPPPFDLSRPTTFFRPPILFTQQIKIAESTSDIIWDQSWQGFREKRSHPPTMLPQFRTSLVVSLLRLDCLLAYHAS